MVDGSVHIIHYVDWQAEKGLGTRSTCGYTGRVDSFRMTRQNEAARILYAAADRLLVNIQSDVIHNVS
jgi:hypothetical protein